MASGLWLLLGRGLRMQMNEGDRYEADAACLGHWPSGQHTLAHKTALLRHGHCVQRRRSYNCGTGDFIVQPLATMEVMR